MNKLSQSAYSWITDRPVLDGTTVAVVQVGIASARRTGLTHHVADAAEITLDGRSTLAASYLCGGNTIDGVAYEDGETVDCVTCRLAAATPATCVYFCWGEDDELLYVGSTTRAPKRLQQHFRETPWWSEVRRLTFEAAPDEPTVRQIELARIAERPGKYNRTGVRKPARTSPLLGLIDGGAA